MPISTLDEVIADPYLADVNFWHEADHPTEGRIRLMEPPITLSKTPAEIHRLPPRFGEHTREVRSEEHTSELQSLMRISYAVFCLKKKNRQRQINRDH